MATNFAETEKYDWQVNIFLELLKVNYLSEYFAYLSEC